MYKTVDLSRLPVLASHADVALFDLHPDVIFILDLDVHAFWWANAAGVAFWGLDNVQQVIDKDMSGDTASARRRMQQTFEKAALEGVSVDPWTAYPNEQPTRLHIRHKAVLLGPERHRGTIAFISDGGPSGDNPEQCLFAEAIHYTSVAVTSFSLEGLPLFENPIATELYGYAVRDDAPAGVSVFESRFHDLQEGRERLRQGQALLDSSQDHLMITRRGVRKHTLDMRASRHPVSGEYVILVSEYDISALQQALDESERAKAELKKLAHYDALTGVPTVRLCKDRLDRMIAVARRNEAIAALLFIDLDGFKAVNDQHGHDAGDCLLKEVAVRLQSSVRASDTVGRIGGDEFIVLIPDLQQREHAGVVAHQIIKTLSMPVTVTSNDGSEVEVYIGASIGVASFPHNGDDPEALLRNADAAMYQIKRQGKNNYGYA
ncbi:diguanylate cyclase domain-containing protein [Hahella sp. NBU794]|uniref:diguanylate cyclase domain-containing protein n=1 Tax=Hahella sp. NBU794 TaxID=3422590 RepID=UPI003D6EA071